MKKYIGKRIVQLIPVLLSITFLSFAMMRAAGIPFRELVSRLIQLGAEL